QRGQEQERDDQRNDKERYKERHDITPFLWFLYPKALSMPFRKFRNHCRTLIKIYQHIDRFRPFCPRDGRTLSTSRARGTIPIVRPVRCITFQSK
ncbi:hypothetical protein, partial [Bifidobacterium ruminantium]|uniref:hypothetical protein n=1 Tax=Bifidobacterium ruminantium TaxID=78346 RepID=UPI00249190BB